MSAAPLALARVPAPDAFRVPVADTVEFVTLPQPAREGVNRWLAILGAVARATAAGAGLVAAFRVESRRTGGAISWSAIREKHFAFERAGRDWRVLVDRRLKGSGTETGNLKPALVAHFQDLCAQNQRCVSQAYETLVAQYQAGELIPGHGCWRDHFPHARVCPPDLPAGWSLRNFRRHAPDSYVLRAARQGRAAAADQRCKVLTTRVGLAIGQEYQIDDQEYDLKVNLLAPGAHQGRAMRPLGLDAVDVLSAHQVLNGFLPTLWDPRKHKKIKAVEPQVPLFILALLGEGGGVNRRTGTTVTCEHGCATVSEDFERRLFDHAGVRLRRGGIDRRPAHAGLFESAARGNFRVKALIEGSRNLVRNKMADTALFPGATGLSRDAAPVELDGRDRANNRWLKAALGAGMREDLAPLLLLPFLEWSQFVSLAVELYRVINARTDHAMEGWMELGFVAHEWRPAAELPWLPVDRLADLAPEAEMAMRGLMEADARLCRTRRLSPAEVWRRGRGELSPLGDELLPLLLPPDGVYGVERTLDEEDCFTWQDTAVSPRPCRFLGRIGGRMLPKREKFLTWANPFSPGRLVVCDAKGRLLGSCPAYDVPSRADEGAARRQMGAVAKIEREKLAPLVRLGGRMARQMAAAREHNVALLTGQPTTAAGRRELKTLTAVAGDGARTPLPRHRRSRRDNHIQANRKHL